MNIESVLGFCVTGFLYSSLWVFRWCILLGFCLALFLEYLLFGYRFWSVIIFRLGYVLACSCVWVFVAYLLSVVLL